MHDNTIVDRQLGNDFINHYNELCQRADDLEMAMEIALDEERDKDKKAEIIRLRDGHSLVAWSKEACEPFGNSLQKLGDKLPIPLAPADSDPQTNPWTKPEPWKPVPL